MVLIVLIIHCVPYTNNIIYFHSGLDIVVRLFILHLTRYLLYTFIIKVKLHRDIVLRNIGVRTELHINTFINTNKRWTVVKGKGERQQMV